MCPKVESGTEGWPFPNYAWNVEGQSGAISTQPCPSGQNGQATWKCGFDGDWIGFPDLSDCFKIDTSKAIEELQDENSVPSHVIQKLNNELVDENELGAGDIKNIIDIPIPFF